MPMMSRDAPSLPPPQQQRIFVNSSSFAGAGSAGVLQPSQQHVLPQSRAEIASPYRSIRVLFMHQSAFTRTNYWNLCIQWVTGSDVIHCEVYFPATRESLSVDGAHPVFLEVDKNYTYVDWDMYNVQVTEEQYHAMYRWAQTQVGKPFDEQAFRCYLCSGMCTPAGKEPKAWLCSRLTVAALKHGGIIPAWVSEYTLSPSGLRSNLLKMHAEGSIQLEQMVVEVKKQE